MSIVDPDLHSLVTEQEKSPSLLAKLSEEIDLRRPSISNELSQSVLRNWPLEYSIEDFLDVSPLQKVIADNSKPMAHIHATIMAPSKNYLAGRPRGDKSELVADKDLDMRRRLKQYSESLFIRLFFFEENPVKNKKLASAINEFVTKDKLGEKEKKKIMSTLIKLIDSPSDAESGPVSSRIKLARQLIHMLAFPQVLTPDTKETRQHALQQLCNLNPVRAIADICSQFSSGRNKGHA